MDKEVVREAILLLISNQREIGKRHSRVHNNTGEDNAQRLRAINGGICGCCVNLRIDFVRSGDKDRVMLKCKEGLSPLDLYRNTDLGKKAYCPKFIEQ